MKTIKIAVSVSFLLLFSTALFAEIKATDVKGTVAYRDGRSWVPLKINQVLKEGTRVSTGANSSAEIRLNRLNHTITLKPLSMIQVFSEESDSSTKTHIGLKRGGLNARVPRDSNVKTIFKVSTPVATSSVRGTEENIGYGPGIGMTVEVVKGEIEGRNRLGKTSRITGRQRFSQEQGKGKQENILKEVQNNSSATVHGHGLTTGERETMHFSGTDQTGSPDGDTEVLNNQGGGDAKINSDIMWPGDELNGNTSIDADIMWPYDQGTGTTNINADIMWPYDQGAGNTNINADIMWPYDQGAGNTNINAEIMWAK